MMTILLYGFLGRRFGRVHRRDVRSPAEAVRALSVTLPGFRQAVRTGGAFRVLTAGAVAHGRETLAEPQSQRETLRIVPVIAGAGGGLGKVVLGGALIFAGAMTGMPFLSSMGYSMVLGGVSQMLSPTPQAEPTQTHERPENRPSFSFDGAVNTAAQGNPVPVCYGRLIVGSQVVSAGLVAEQI